MARDRTVHVKHNDVTAEIGSDRVASIKIRRPPNNFIDSRLMLGLIETIDLLETSEDCRCIVLCSEGAHFCGGANFTNMSPSRSEGDTPLADLVMRFLAQPIPLVAAVQGSAIGAGLGLALLADFRIASAESRFSANFALLGIHHGFALSVTLPAVVGQQAALDMLYTGRRVRGDEAHQMGLCDRMTSAETIQWEARSFAADIAAAAPLAVRSIRETMHRELLEKARLALTRERSEQERLMETDDWKRGVAAVNARARADFRRE